MRHGCRIAAALPAQRPSQMKQREGKKEAWAMKRKLLIALLCAAALCSPCESALGESCGAVALSGERTQFTENEAVALTVSPNPGYELASLTYTPAYGSAEGIAADAGCNYSFTGFERGAPG